MVAGGVGGWWPVLTRSDDCHLKTAANSGDSSWAAGAGKGKLCGGERGKKKRTCIWLLEDLNMS